MLRLCLCLVLLVLEHLAQLIDDFARVVQTSDSVTTAKHLLDAALHVVDRFLLARYLVVQRSNSRVLVDEFTHIHNLPLLNQQVLQLLYLAYEGGSRTCSILTYIRLQFVKLNTLCTCQSLQLTILVLQCVALLKKTASLLAQLIHLR